MAVERNTTRRKKKRTNKKKEKEIKKDFTPVVPLVSSGCDMLDLALGGGYGWGKIVNILGDEATGKTLLTIETLVAAYKDQKKKLDWFWDDTERGYSFPDSAIWGLDILKDTDTYSETIEEWMYNVRKKLQTHIDNGTPYLYITDSLDGITTEAEQERATKRDQNIEQGKKEKGGYKAEKAKLLSEFFRLLKGDIHASHCLFIVISQLRASLSPFGESKTRSGGKALDFYASQIVRLTVLNKIKETYKGHERITGVVIRAMVTKNKLWKPYRDCRFIVLFDYGIDNIDSNLCFLFDLYDERTKLPKKSIRVAFDGHEFKTRAKLIKHIEDNNLEAVLSDACKEKWNEIENALDVSDRKLKE